MRWFPCYCNARNQAPPISPTEKYCPLIWDDGFQWWVSGWYSIESYWSCLNFRCCLHSFWVHGTWLDGCLVSKPIHFLWCIVKIKSPLLGIPASASRLLRVCRECPLTLPMQMPNPNVNVSTPSSSILGPGLSINFLTLLCHQCHVYYINSSSLDVLGKIFYSQSLCGCQSGYIYFWRALPWPRKKHINKNGGGYSDLSFWVLFQFEGTKSEEPQIKDVVPVD